MSSDIEILHNFLENPISLDLEKLKYGRVSASLTTDSGREIKLPIFDANDIFQKVRFHFFFMELQTIQSWYPYNLEFYKSNSFFSKSEIFQSNLEKFQSMNFINFRNQHRISDEGLDTQFKMTLRDPTLFSALKLNHVIVIAGLLPSQRFLNILAVQNRLIKFGTGSCNHEFSK